MDRLFCEKALYRSLYSAVLACIGLFMPFFGIGTVTWKNALVLCVVLSLSVGISLLPARGKGLCLFLVVLCLGVPVAIVGFSTSYDFLQAYLQWCGGYGGDLEQWLEGFRSIHTAVITAAAFLIQILAENFKMLKFGLACLMAGGILFSLFAQVPLTHMGVAFSMLYIVEVYVEWRQEHWKKTRSGSLKAQMLWLSPFLAIYLLMMVIMPAPETPFGWQWAINIYNNVKESVLVVTQNLFRGGQEDFSTALSGFSDDADLGEGIHEDEREVMHIQAERTLATNVYLIGKVYDTFDGREWQQEYHDSEKERFIDTMETVYAVRRLDDGYRMDYLGAADIRIRYDFFHTEYVLAPLKARSIYGRESFSDYSFDGGDLVFARRKGYGTEYDAAYYQLNMGEELFSQLLESRKEPDESLWSVIAREYENQIGQKITLEMLKSHRQRIYENYLDEITLSKEAESYLAEITEGAETDLERLQAIERELQSYTYTRWPGKLPDEVTDAGKFLDYFLLESRQGYCTYFATAFVLLARTEGIPARYVQGFCVPMKGSSEAAVLSSMAHSWPEVYIEDVGWIPFEPTPGYEGLRYTPWDVTVRDDSYEEKEEWGEEAQENVLEWQTEETAAEEDTEDIKSDVESGLTWIRRVLVIGIPIILVGSVLALLWDHLLGMYRYKKMNLSEKIKIEVRKNLRLLSWLGIKRKEQETLQELRERGMLMPGMTSLRFIGDYEDMLYGGKREGEEMLERVKKEREKLWDLLREEKRMTYLFYRARMFLVRYR